MDNIFKGKLVRLRGVEASDWEFFYQLDFETTELARSSYEIRFPPSKERVKAWTEAQSTAKPDGDEFRYQIEALEGEILVGSLNVHSTNPRVGTFMYGITVAPEYQRRGYAAEAVRLVLNYYFHEKRYQKVNAEVYSFNTPSLKLHEHMGFTLEGRLRRMVYTDGEFYDTLIFGMTREEFEAHTLEL